MYDFFKQNEKEIKDNFRYDDVSGLIVKTKTNRKLKGTIVKRTGKKTIKIKENSIYYHRLVWFLKTGDWEQFIIHKDGDFLNNRFENLELTDSLSSYHIVKKTINRNNKTGVKGVSLYRKKLFRSQIFVKGRSILLGVFDNLEDAKQAREKAESKYM